MSGLTTRKTRQTRQTRQTSKQLKPLQGGQSLFSTTDFNWGWNALSFLVTKPDEDEDTTLAFPVYPFKTNPINQYAKISPNVLTLYPNEISVLYFAGLGMSLKRASRTGFDIMKTFESLKYSATVYVIDQMSSFSLESLIQSCAELINELVVIDKPLYIIGFSLGTGISTYSLLRWQSENTFSSRRISLILLSPFTSLVDAFYEKKSFDEANDHEPTMFENIANEMIGNTLNLQSALKQIKDVDITIVSALDDEITFYGQAKRLFELVSKSKSIKTKFITLESGGHWISLKNLKNKSYLKLLL